MMKLKPLMTIKSVICSVFGLGFLLIPSQVAFLFGMTIDLTGDVMTRFFGAAFILLGLLLFLARNSEDYETNKAFAISIALGDLIGFGVALFAVFSGVFNVLGWLVAALYLLLAIGFGYIFLSEPQGKLAT